MEFRWLYRTGRDSSIWAEFAAAGRRDSFKNADERGRNWSGKGQHRMLWLAAIGFFMGAAGLAGVLYCMCSAWIARKSATDDKALRDRIGKLVPVNLVSLMIAATGLVVATVAFVL